MEHGNEKKMIDILQSIDESLKILAGRKQQSKPEVKKTYKDAYFTFGKSDNGKWEEVDKDGSDKADT